MQLRTGMGHRRAQERKDLRNSRSFRLHPTSSPLVSVWVLMKLGVLRCEVDDHPVCRHLFYLLPFYRLLPILALVLDKLDHHLPSPLRLEVS